jgi:hypothetical protein
MTDTAGPDLESLQTSSAASRYSMIQYVVAF